MTVRAPAGEGCRLLAAAIAAFLMGGCAATSVRPSSTSGASVSPPRPNVNLSGYSPSFKQGYVEGCDSARRGRGSEAQRAGGDTDYVMGWNDGYSICSRRR